MKLFTCSSCGQTVFFENVQCTRCGASLAYLPDRKIVSALEPAQPSGDAPPVHVALAPEAAQARYRLCANYVAHGVCNWAVYLHMVDTLETARSYGLVLRPEPVGGGSLPPMTVRRLAFDDFDDLKNAWVPLTIALNSLNRGMGLPDLYPFVLSDAAVRKLQFVHDVVDETAAAGRS